MKIYLIGTGCGSTDMLSQKALQALKTADRILGAERILSTLPVLPGKKIAAIEPANIAREIERAKGAICCVVYSGDSGFYSGARSLLPFLEEMDVELLPGISSVQMLSARLKQPWQNWKLVSAHGKTCDVIREILSGQAVFFLTGGTVTPAVICQELVSAGLGQLQVTVGENLYLSGEQITIGTASMLAKRNFSALSVLLCEPAPIFSGYAAGITDDEFFRGNVPMTKHMVRSAILAKLAPTKSSVCWDIGAGTGSVSAVLALSSAHVWAVEREAEGCELIRANREKFCAWNLHVVCGAAPDVLADLPAPDLVFVGGSGGKLEQILEFAYHVNPGAKYCVSAIAIETLHTAVNALSKLGLRTEVTQLAVSESREVGQLHMLFAQNPIFLITGETP